MEPEARKPKQQDPMPQPPQQEPQPPQPEPQPAKIGVAADHGGFELKARLVAALTEAGHQVEDFGAHQYDPGDDYPDFVLPLARAVAAGAVKRGVAVCGSGVGASVLANKVPGVRSALVAEVFSAHQGVEDDDMNLMCLGGRVLGFELAWEYVRVFLAARFSGLERHRRRLRKVAAAEVCRGGGA